MKRVSKWFCLVAVAAAAVGVSAAAAHAAPQGPGGPPPVGGAGGPGGPGGQRGPGGPGGQHEMRPPMPPPQDGQRDAAADPATDTATDAADGPGADAPPPCDHGGGGGGGGREAGRRPPRHDDPRKLSRLLAGAADTDASGDVTADELAAFLAALGADESGAISMDALVALLPAPPADAPEGAAPDAAELADRLTHDLDHDADGVVEVEDVQWFLSLLDHDADGAVSGTELTPPRPLRGKARRAAMALARAADADDSRDVSAEEWTAFLDGLVLVDEETGAVSLDDLASKLPGKRHGSAGDDGADTTKRDAALVKCFDRDGDGVVEVSDLQAVFDELDVAADGRLTKREARAKR